MAGEGRPKKSNPADTRQAGVSQLMFDHEAAVKEMARFKVGQGDLSVAEFAALSHFAVHGSAARAYDAAFPDKKTSKGYAGKVSFVRLLATSPEGSRFLDEWRERMAENTQLTKLQLSDSMRALADKAEDDGDYANAIKALAHLGRWHGMDDRNVNLNVSKSGEIWMEMDGPGDGGVYKKVEEKNEDAPKALNQGSKEEREKLLAGLKERKEQLEGIDVEKELNAVDEEDRKRRRESRKSDDG